MKDSYFWVDDADGNSVEISIEETPDATDIVKAGDRMYIYYDRELIKIYMVAE